MKVRRSSHRRRRRERARSARRARRLLCLESLEDRLLLTTVTVDLIAASDTGSSNTDNITSDTTPTYDVTVDTSGLIKIDWENDGTDDIVDNPGGAGTYQYTPAAPLADANYTVLVTFKKGGDTVTDTDPTTIDTTAPGAP